MKICKIFSCLTILSAMLIFSGCIKSTNEIIPSPSKIIAYKNGQTKTLTSADKEYQNIVALTNARVEKNKLSLVKDGVEIDNYVNCEKKSATAIEFIYDEETVIDLNNSNGFSPIQFNKLFFKLNKDDGNGNEIFEYGNKYKYIDSSRGFLKEPTELLEYVYTILE